MPPKEQRAGALQQKAKSPDICIQGVPDCCVASGHCLLHEVSTGSCLFCSQKWPSLANKETVESEKISTSCRYRAPCSPVCSLDVLLFLPYFYKDLAVGKGPVTRTHLVVLREAADVPVTLCTAVRCRPLEEHALLLFFRCYHP